MKQTTTKSIFPWIIVIAVFMSGFYLSSQRTELSNDPISIQNNLVENQLDDEDYSVRQKLMHDFEVAFLKQYTPQIGCGVLENETKTRTCIEHREQAKNDFKQQFIKNRGLPKNTFEELKLSFSD
ncbi:MAG: hypothetical protein ACRBDX_08680 [Gammaproteobacteria bacterium]